METFVGELFRGLNFQKIKFLWMVVPQNFEPNKDIFVENFYTCAMAMQSSHAVPEGRGYHVYEDIWGVAVGENINLW